MQHDYRQILRYGFGILAIISGFLLLFFTGNGFSSFEEIFQVFNYEERFTGSVYPFGFTATTYWLALAFLAVLLPGNLLVFYKTRSTDYKPGLFKTVEFPFLKLRQQWRKLPSWEKAVFLFTGLFLLGSRIYLLRIFPVITDEAATHVLFVSKGLKGILPYYPLPNNHFLYSVLCVPFTYLFEKPFWILKLPSVLISLALFPVLYLSLRSVFRFPAAFIATIGCCFANYALYYSVHGRGYMLLLFCTVVCSLSVLKIIQQKEPAYWLWFMLSGIAGFYTVPVFLYPFGSMAVFAAIYFLASKNFRSFLSFVLACAFIVSGIFLLYSPAILISGFEHLFGNSYIQPVSWKSFLQSLPFYTGYMHGAMIGQETIGKYLWLAGIGLLLFLLIFRHRLSRTYAENNLTPEVMLWALCGSVLPFALLTIQRVMPPERIWLFLAFADFLLLGIAFQVTANFLFRRTPKALPVFTIAGMLLFITYQGFKVRQFTIPGRSQSETAEQVLRNIHQYNYHTVFSNCNAYGLNIVYEFAYSGEGAYVFDEFTPKSGLTYEVLLLGTDKKLPAAFNLSAYKLYYKDPLVTIYFLK